MHLLLIIAVLLGACSQQPMAQILPGDPPPPLTGLTWYKDVQPIVNEHCVSCHNQGDIAPFSLTSFADARSRHQLIANEVHNKTMPPWMPEEKGCQPLRDARKLSNADIATIEAWSEQGAKEGDPKDADQNPPTPKKTLSYVSETLDPGADYTPPQASDEYHCFVLNPEIAAVENLIGVDVQPGVRSQVHHVLLYTATAATAAAADAKTPELGWSCFGIPDTGSALIVGGWVPGSVPMVFPENTGIPIVRGQVIVMQVHYNLEHHSALTGEHQHYDPKPDRTRVLLQYSKYPVKYQAQIVPLAQKNFAIPPQSIGSATAQLPMTGPIKIWGVMPHMHQLGSKIRVDMEKLFGSSSCIVDIPRWSFHWQQIYFFENAVAAPTAGLAKLTCTWDNTTDRTVNWGENSSDEMCLNYFYVTY